MSQEKSSKNFEIFACPCKESRDDAHSDALRIRGDIEQKTILTLKQPMTAGQLAQVSSRKEGVCSRILRKYEQIGILSCLNPASSRSRLYWFTPKGLQDFKAWCTWHEKPFDENDFPNVNWELYGWVCYAHREAIILAMKYPMNPATLRRKACAMFPQLRMSANNARDIIRLFVRKGIVKAVRIKKRFHPAYELTPRGKAFQILLSKTSCIFRPD